MLVSAYIAFAPTDDPAVRTPPPDPRERALPAGPHVVARRAHPPSTHPARSSSFGPARDGGRSESVRWPLPAWALEALDLGSSETAGLVSNLEPIGEDLHPTDLAVLAEIIESNGLDESTSLFDHDDGDGNLEAWELGYQLWRDGRLLLLATAPSPRFTYGYAIHTLPDAVADLAELEVLDLHGNDLERLPEALGALPVLRELRLDENRLGSLPKRIGDIATLRRLYVGSNELVVLPGHLGRLQELETLAADDNPLAWIEPGALESPRLQILGLEQSRNARRDVVTTGAGLHELPEQLAYLPLEELRVGGNRLYCNGQPPAYLRDGSIRSVVGLSAQACLP
jgi:hypothetical protein